MAVDSSGHTFWKRATGSEGATTTWTSIFDASEICMWLILAYRGCDTGASVINAQGTPEDSASGTAKDGPTLTPTVNDCAIVTFFTADPGVDPLTFTPDASINYRAGGSVAPIDSQDGVTNIVIGIDRILSGGSGTPITLGGDLGAADGACEFSYALAPAAVAAPGPTDLAPSAARRFLHRPDRSNQCGRIYSVRSSTLVHHR